MAIDERQEGTDRVDWDMVPTHAWSVLRPRAIDVVMLCLLAVLGSHCASAEGTRAREGALINGALARFPGAERGTISAVLDEELTRTLPGYAFYVLRFRQYPVALVPPGPLQASNVLVVGQDDSVAVLVDVPALENFFRSTVRPVTTEAQARAVAKAWLRLSEELAQDGFLRFSIPENSVTVGPAASGGQQVTGKAVVAPQTGNRGEIDATLIFDPAGKLVSVTETRNIKRGIRPICQATKLLDPDPVIRGMAEQDILVMGKAAKQYLDEQRATAPPELRQAIDRLWQQILAERY